MRSVEQVRGRKVNWEVVSTPGLLSDTLLPFIHLMKLSHSILCQHCSYWALALYSSVQHKCSATAQQVTGPAPCTLIYYYLKIKLKLFSSSRPGVFLCGYLRHWRNDTFVYLNYVALAYERIKSDHCFRKYNCKSSGSEYKSVIIVWFG